MIHEIISLRKELHQYPELSGQEKVTAKRISAFIEKHYPTRIIQHIGGHGLAAIYAFPTPGPTIAIRCELDALPIEEENDFAHRSRSKGVSHKCGHDGHMAMVAGLIFWLKKQAFSRGKIILLFQPAEETGQGAYLVSQDENIKALGIDYFFALHNIPGETLHSIITMDKGFSAEVQSFALTLTGKEAHAAEPENGRNPALAMAQITLALEALNVNNPHSEDFTVLTPVYSSLGQKSYGISPVKGELHYTVRTWSTKKMEVLKDKLTGIFTSVGHANELIHQEDWFEHFPASVNDTGANQYVIDAANKQGLSVITRPYPFKFGEDFGWFSKEYKTAMFGLGAGQGTPALHHADYDFPDELIETGMAAFQGIISEILG